MNSNQPYNLDLLPPPKINYINLLEEIAEARAMLGEIKGQLRHINPKLLATPLLRKEAILSSRIEGTQATMEAIFNYEAQEEKPQTSIEEIGYKEILNYSSAVEYSMGNLEKRPIGENLVKEIHKILMDSVRGANKNPGNFRKLPVAIGTLGRPVTEATYIPPVSSKIPGLLSNWEKYMNTDIELDLLVRIGVGHYQFEAIHPFMDGNGRIGRLLIPIFLCQYELLQYPVLYISQYFEEHRQDYYKLLQNVTEKKEWEGWLKFFLIAMIDTSKNTLMTLNDVDTLYDELKDSINAVNSIYAINLLDIIFQTPVVSFSTLKNRLGAKSHQTVYDLLQKFVEKGILKGEDDKLRGRRFRFDKLISLLE